MVITNLYFVKSEVDRAKVVDDETKIDNLRHLSMKDTNEKLWIAVIQSRRNKWGELYVKFRVYK